VLIAINTGIVTARDFVPVGGSVALTASGRKEFFRAYELRMDTLVTHSLFDYRVSYRPAKYFEIVDLAERRRLESRARLRGRDCPSLTARGSLKIE
jgi:CRISPR/Cas system-associated endonuclease Cas1